MDQFEKYLNDFTEQLRVLKYSPQTIHSYTYHLQRFFRWLSHLHITDPRDVTPTLLTRYHALIAPTYSPHTVSHELSTIKHFFAWLERTNQLLYNPSEKLHLPKIGDRLPKDILTIKEIKRLLASPNIATPLGLRDRAILELLYSTGIRRSECTALSVYDADYKQGFLRVNAGKGARQRVVPLGKKACAYLRRYLLRVRPGLAKNNPDAQALFLMRSGKALSHQALEILVKNHGRKAKIQKPVTIHGIRHTFATHMLRSNAHPLYIQRLLGHATSTTMRKYIRVTGADLKATHKKTHPRERDKR